MTEKMIDLDIVIERIASIYHRVQTPTESDYSLWFMSKDIELRNLFLHCLDDLTREINELATPAPEPQESIFDADGWCWDLSLIDNDDEYHFLIESHRDGVGYKVTDKKSYYQLIGLTWFIDGNLKENECVGDKIIAWKPIANLPKDRQ